MMKIPKITENKFHQPYSNTTSMLTALYVSDINKTISAKQSNIWSIFIS